MKHVPKVKLEFYSLGEDVTVPLAVTGIEVCTSCSWAVLVQLTLKPTIFFFCTLAIIIGNKWI